MKIYLAGPMRGRPRVNQDSFAFYAKQLRDAGHFVFDPSGLEVDAGTGTSWSRQELQGVMLLDMQMITTMDVVFLLPEWWTSKGAMAEKYFAHFLDIPVVDYNAKTWTFATSVIGPAFRKHGDPTAIIAIAPQTFQLLKDIEDGVYV